MPNRLASSRTELERGLGAAVSRVQGALAHPDDGPSRALRLLDAIAPSTLSFGLTLLSDIADPIHIDGPHPRVWHASLAELASRETSNSPRWFSIAASPSRRPQLLDAVAVFQIANDKGELIDPHSHRLSLGAKPASVVPIEHAKVSTTPDLGRALALGDHQWTGSHIGGLVDVIEGLKHAYINDGYTSPRGLLAALIAARRAGLVCLAHDGTALERHRQLRAPFVVARSHALAHQIAKRIARCASPRGHRAELEATFAPARRGIYLPAPLAAASNRTGRSGERKDEQSSPHPSMSRVPGAGSRPGSGEHTQR